MDITEKVEVLEELVKILIEKLDRLTQKQEVDGLKHHIFAFVDDRLERIVYHGHGNDDASVDLWSVRYSFDTWYEKKFAREHEYSTEQMK